MEWLMWVTIGLGIASGLLGTAFYQLAKQLSKASIETGEFLISFGEAIEDGEMTADEARAVWDELKDVPGPWMLLWGMVLRLVRRG